MAERAHPEAPGFKDKYFGLIRSKRVSMYGGKIKAYNAGFSKTLIKESIKITKI